ncbi:MAG TPA: hypothetical protein VG323_10225 [Thermoanaerobaculia bacterium]|nr:hypothetical protein [Thermoanaerobaculia bacterium]
MSTAIKSMDDTELAEEIVSVLDARVVRVCSDDRENLRYAVRGAMKLRSVVLGRAALRRLLHDRDGAVKIEYLQRDLLRTAEQRGEYVYPRRSAINPLHEQPAAVAAI